MVQGEGVIAAPCLYEPTGKGKYIHNQSESQPRSCNAAAHIQNCRGQVEGNAGITFARHCGELRTTEHLTLNDKNGQCKYGEDQRQSCCHARVDGSAHNGKKDFSRQHRKLSTQNDGIAKVGHAFNEAHQEGIGQTRFEKWQCDAPKGLHSRGAQGLRGFFQRRTDTLHHPAHDHESDGRKGKHLGQPNAKDAIEPSCGRNAKGPLQGLVDQA